jgi:hypothetical protein
MDVVLGYLVDDLFENNREGVFHYFVDRSDKRYRRI